MVFSEPSAGAGHNYADKEASWIDFTVTPSVNSGTIVMTVTDPKGLLTSMKMTRAVIGDAIDQWLSTNAAQLVTNSVSVGNDSNSDDIGGSNANRPPGDGFYGWVWSKSAGTATTPSITTTSLTTTGITVSKPYADVV